ncbi:MULTISPECIES: NUDIX domain-containing protein [unclassified Mucilaginibacter]|uniref:NUDIX domain-containing protein n=1 Tax=unclassified Mucilaginibacter TaxID=2617802 RepID=UPI000963FB04|nr:MULTISPECIES: NUDIX domain-containing protein [unclassified Mucilaginibacter]OJW18536.1 MAG: NUDIX hydrolase [Mucilaginibacter sp. 44-25]PLW88916.1 MAG: NUDIX hydrolase [Mucilaginibacter sp.]HEK20299.1 NUDIX domain-containing protein [Bacteroidota bacterium]
MGKQSAGLLLYRIPNHTIEVFLVHPGGPFFAKKDNGSWSIPKGEFNDDEDALTAAKREFEEETGKPIDGNFIKLHPIRQKSGKTVHAWAVEGDIDHTNITSNTFEIEWPPRSGKRKTFPEIDRAGWFTLHEAKEKLIPAQIKLVEELESIL